MGIEYFIIGVIISFGLGFLYARYLFKDNPPEKKIKKKFKFTYETWKWDFDTIIYAYNEEEAVKKFKKEVLIFDSIIKIESL